MNLKGETIDLSDRAVVVVLFFSFCGHDVDAGLFLHLGFPPSYKLFIPHFSCLEPYRGTHGGMYLVSSVEVQMLSRYRLINQFVLVNPSPQNSTVAN